MSNLFGRIKRRFEGRAAEPCAACGNDRYRGGIRCLGRTFCGDLCLPAFYRRALIGYAKREPA